MSINVITKEELPARIEKDERLLAAALNDGKHKEAEIVLIRLERHYETMAKLGECAPCN